MRDLPLDLALPPLSERDRADLAFGVAHGIDMVFASFVRKASDVKEARHTPPSGLRDRVLRRERLRLALVRGGHCALDIGSCTRVHKKAVLRTNGRMGGVCV